MTYSIDIGSKKNNSPSNHITLLEIPVIKMGVCD
jgi:hypothetical protein